VLAAHVESGGSVSDAAAGVGIRRSTAKRRLPTLRARPGLTTEHLIYRGRAEGWLVRAESGALARPLLTVRHDDDLASGVPLVQVPKGLAGLAQRIRPPDGGAAIGESLQVPEKSKEKADLMHAIYDGITVAGPEIVGVRLTSAAYAHGLALALPEKAAMARPTGLEPATFGSGTQRSIH
jgi:hypothetical protein